MLCHYFLLFFFVVSYLHSWYEKEKIRTVEVGKLRATRCENFHGRVSLLMGNRMEKGDVVLHQNLLLIK